MVLKTFNLEQETYQKFSNFCREHGISMSKQVNLFIEMQLAEEPEVKKKYLKKLDRISNRGKFIEVEDFSKRYGL
ncbi:hypothetical protein HOD29_00870 [archaeon]|jgi:hypothetical protein|nr:hypothetical protein [archaeon]